MMFEALEDRRLLAAQIVGNTLFVRGTDRGEIIEVTRKMTNTFPAGNTVIVTVYINKVPQIFSNAGNVQRVVIEALGGNDVIKGNFVLTDVFGQIVGGLAQEIFGGDGNDTIVGGAGNDRIYGGDGNDSISGGIGFDSLAGDNGNDTLVGGANADAFSGGAGIDTADYSSAAGPLSISLDGKANDGLTDGRNSEGDNVYTDVENVIGGRFNDRISGSSSSNSLYGGEGKDTLLGGAGNDRLFGGGGDDWLQGDDGNDILYGRDGANDQGKDSLYGGTGTDTAYAGPADLVKTAETIRRA